MRCKLQCDGCHDYHHEYSFNYYKDKLLCLYCIQALIDDIEGRDMEDPI